MKKGNAPDLKAAVEASSSSKGKTKICLISGGETTVTLSDVDAETLETSKGGRNQEVTLAFEFLFGELTARDDHHKKPNIAGGGGSPLAELLFSSFGTDGSDGPTDAAGAFYEYPADCTEFDASFIHHFLAKHDSYHYYDGQKRLLKTGPTGTNVSDMQILILKF